MDDFNKTPPSYLSLIIITAAWKLKNENYVNDAENLKKKTDQKKKTMIM